MMRLLLKKQKKAKRKKRKEPGEKRRRGKRKRNWKRERKIILWRGILKSENTRRIAMPLGTEIAQRRRHPPVRRTNTREGATLKRGTIPGTETAQRKRFPPGRRTNTALRRGTIPGKRSTHGKENTLKTEINLG